MTDIDTGRYNKDEDVYKRLVTDLYLRYPDGVTLPPEYAHFVQEDSLRLLIRLARYKFVARLLKKSDHLLEVGSGSGLGSIFLAQHCRRVTGLEVKKSEVVEANAINDRKNVEFIKSDLFDLENSNNYDVVAALDVIEHLSVEGGHKLVRAMASQLKATGMLVIGTPSIYSYQYQGDLSRASHVKCYDQPELIELIEEFFERTLAFSMNDEIVHTGHHKMAWYYFVLAFMPKIKPGVIQDEPRI